MNGGYLLVEGGRAMVRTVLVKKLLDLLMNVCCRGRQSMMVYACLMIPM